MSKPYIHAISSARKFGGHPEDYMPVHNLLDSSKGAIPDNRHRALTHNSWFLSSILEHIHMPAFGWHGALLTRPSDGKVVSVRDIGEQHILEDFGDRFIPTAQDYLQEMEIKGWMWNAQSSTPPTSHTRLAEHQFVSGRRID